MTTWIYIYLALEKSWVFQNEMRLLKNWCVREEIEMEIGKCFEFSGNKTH